MRREIITGVIVIWRLECERARAMKMARNLSLRGTGVFPLMNMRAGDSTVRKTSSTRNPPSITESPRFTSKLPPGTEFLKITHTNVLIGEECRKEECSFRRDPNTTRLLDGWQGLWIGLELVILL